MSTSKVEQNPSHPHDFYAGAPYGLSKDDLRRLSTISPIRSLAPIAGEWLMIGMAIYLCEHFWNPALYVITVMFIAARQHALAVLSHEAVHYRLLNRRNLGEWIADIFLAWPWFNSGSNFRKVHGPHHQFLGTEKDANIGLWNTHNKDGTLTEEWTYPKTRFALFLKLARRSWGFHGLKAICRTTIQIAINAFRKDRTLNDVVRFVYTYGVFAAVGVLHLWVQYIEYWLVPICTWLVVLHYLRVILEHSAIPGSYPHNLTRTTKVSFVGRLFVLPLNIGYHIEHHFYPSIPHYNLPEAHAILMQQKDYRESAHVTDGVVNGLREVTNIKQSVTTGDSTADRSKSSKAA